MSTKEDEILGILSKLADEQREARSETAKSLFDLDKKVDLHIQKTEYELKRINDQDEIQNRLLDQHIQGVNTLKNLYEQHEEKDDARFEKLEEPRKFMKTLGKIVVGMGALGAGIAGVLELIARLKGH